MQHDKSWVLPERGDDIIALSTRPVRELKDNKVEVKKLSPEDYARLVRLKELIEDVLGQR